MGRRPLGLLWPYPSAGVFFGLSGVPVAFWRHDTMGVPFHPISKLNTQPTDAPVQTGCLLGCSTTSKEHWHGIIANSCRVQGGGVRCPGERNMQWV